MDHMVSPADIFEDEKGRNALASGRGEVRPSLDPPSVLECSLVFVFDTNQGNTSPGSLKSH